MENMETFDTDFDVVEEGFVTEENSKALPLIAVGVGVAALGGAAVAAYKKWGKPALAKMKDKVESRKEKKASEDYVGVDAEVIDSELIKSK